MDYQSSETTMVSLDLLAQMFDEECNRLGEHWPFLKSWRLATDRAKRRAGLCNASKKLIRISEYHCQLNDYSIVLDTLRHEFAHAICFECYGEHAHDHRWRQVARDIGATARATGQFRTADANWLLVHLCSKSGTIFPLAERFRKNKNISHYHVKGRPETKGELYYIRNFDYERYLKGELTLEAIELIQ